MSSLWRYLLKRMPRPALMTGEGVRIFCVRPASELLLTYGYALMVATQVLQAMVSPAKLPSMESLSVCSLDIM